MKNINNYTKSVAILLLICSTLIISCKSKKATIQKVTGAVEITEPFSSSEYLNDKDYFRAVSSGTSPDRVTAEKIAFQNSKSQLASLISTTIKKTTDQYTIQRTIDKTEVNNKFEELAREVTNQEMSNVQVKGKKLFQNPDNSFTYYIALEADKKEVFNGLHNRISNNQKLAQDYDKKKFEEIFNSEMDKLAKERSGN